MKKSLLALAVAAALPAVAQAQSSVTLYGILDAAVEYSNKAAANSSTPSAASGGLRLMDGATTWNGSRFGVRGVEPIGNSGLSGIFGLETRLSLDAGTIGGTVTSSSAQFWNGLAFAGLRGGFGELTVGRQYTPGFYAWLAQDFTGNAGYGSTAAVAHQSVSGLTAGGSNASYGAVRADNSVMLSTTLGALAVRAMVGMGENSVATAANPSNDLYAVSAAWALNKQISFNGFYHKQDSFVTTTLDDAYGIGAKWDNGKMGVTLAFSNLKRHDATEFDSIVVSSYMKVGANTVYLNGNQVKQDTGAESTLVSLAYVQPLSNRTAIYVNTSYVDRTNVNAQTKVALGLNHKF